MNLKTLMERLNSILSTDIFKSDNLNIQLNDLLFLLIIWLITRLLLVIINRIFHKRKQIGRLSASQAFLVQKLLRYFIIVLAIVIALQTIGLELTFLLASSAALFVGIGLGIQDVFKDVISGFVLLFGKTIKVGDVVEVEGIIGRVTDIDFRVSRVVTRDDIDMLIPNSKLVSEKVINWSFNNELTRFHVKIGVAYGSDVERIRDILISVAQNHPAITKSKKPFVRFTDFGESSLDFQLFFWSEQTFRIENILSDLRFDIDKEFKKNNITIPFPQRDIHMKTQ
jgi:small-conductance mechanosensitive channel